MAVRLGYDLTRAEGLVAARASRAEGDSARKIEPVRSWPAAGLPLRLEDDEDLRFLPADPPTPARMTAVLAKVREALLAAHPDV
jgi:hypothetical protein